MLNAQEGVAQHSEQTPLGIFCRKQIDRKYKSVIALKPELADSLVFCEALRRDRQASADISDAHQMRYELHEDSGGVYELELQSGHYQTLAQLLSNEPAVVAEKNFIGQTVKALAELTEKLHEKGIFHLCYAPRTVFVRKSDHIPLLLCHGSSFMGLKDQAAFYEGCEEFVAPEVLAGETPDERSDVYALAKLIEVLFASGDMPYEYKAVVKKATAEEPEKRYPSVNAMYKAIGEKRSMMRSLFMALAALVVAGLLVLFYIDLSPEATNVEFVDDNGLVRKADPFTIDYEEPVDYDENEYMDPETAAWMDSIDMQAMTDEEFKMLSDSVRSQVKLEEIFRRRFEQRATSKLAGLYSNSNMGSSESSFIANSKKVVDELMEYAGQLSEDTGLPKERTSSMATEIISQIQSQMMKNVTRYGSMTKSEEE